MPLLRDPGVIVEQHKRDVVPVLQQTPAVGSGSLRQEKSGESGYS
jgi:hypothetical protein